MVSEFEPHIRLCADSSEPGACFEFCVSLSLCPFPTHALSLPLKNKQTLKKFFLSFSYFGETETEHERGRGRETEGDTESEAGCRL